MVTGAGTTHSGAVKLCTVVILTTAFSLAMLMYREEVPEIAQERAGPAHPRSQ
jgi:hypothetical protein